MKKDITKADILEAVFAILAKSSIHPDVDLNINHAAEITIGSLALDSLDLLQFSMEVEERLDIEMDVVEFPPAATLEEVADHFLALAGNR